MAKSMKKITTGNLVKEIVNVAGVSKENAENILNIFTNAWNVDRIGLLSAVDTGIVKRKATARKATKKKATTKKSTTKKATTKKSTAKKNTQAVAPVKAKKSKKNKKSKKTKTVAPTNTTVEA